MQASDVAGRIHEIRQTLGLTQSQFAQRLGVTKVSIARYEAGRIPRLRVLRDIAKHGDVTLAWLLEGPREDFAQREGRVRHQEANLLGTARDLLAFVQQRASALTALPPQHRERYQERFHELVLRTKRELDEYQQVLEAELRIRPRKARARRR